MSNPDSSVVKRKKPLVPRLMEEAERRVPEKYRPYVKKATPFVIGFANFCDMVYPYLVQFWNILCNLYAKLEPYGPENFIPLIFGLGLVFFGGSYLTLVAAAEAVRLTVWKRLQKAFKQLYDNYQIAKEANAKDDTIDDNNDGIADVDQISSQELFSRKVYVIARSIDPDQTADALSAVWGGLLSILATLRIHFAQCVTLGCALGEMMSNALDKVVQPAITEALPPELKKWGPRLSQQLFYFVGMTLAWVLQRIISSFHSAVRGGTMAVHGGIRLAKRHGLLDDSFDENSQQVTAASIALAMFGFYWQLSNGFSVPFPLNIVMLPATIVEFFLSTCLAV